MTNKHEIFQDVNTMLNEILKTDIQYDLSIALLGGNFIMDSLSITSLVMICNDKYNIDLSKSYMVGDHKRDTDAGINAGCIPVLLAETTENKDSILKFPSLLHFADYLNESSVL